jgi:hypothetical protein
LVVRSHGLPYSSWTISYSPASPALVNAPASSIPPNPLPNASSKVSSANNSYPAKITPASSVAAINIASSVCINGYYASSPKSILASSNWDTTSSTIGNASSNAPNTSSTNIASS